METKEYNESRSESSISSIVSVSRGILPKSWMKKRWTKW